MAQRLQLPISVAISLSSVFAGIPLLVSWRNAGEQLRTISETADSYLEEKLSHASPADDTHPILYDGVQRLREQIQASRDRSLIVLLALVGINSLACLTMLYSALGPPIGKRTRRPQNNPIHASGEGRPTFAPPNHALPRDR